MSLTGKIDVTLKFSEMPKQIIDNGINKEFLLNADGVEITVRVANKIFQRLEKSVNAYPSWVALVEGKMGNATEKGFILDQASLQVFEKKTKPSQEVVSQEIKG